MVRVGVETGYPWDGRIRVTILEAPEVPWTLSIRVPGWCRTASMQELAGEAVPLDAGVRRVDERRVWRSGDAIALTLDLPVRVTSPDPRVDASAGASPSNADRWCTASRPPTCRTASPSRRSSSTPRRHRSRSLGQTSRPEVIGLVVPASQRGAGPVEVGAVPYLAWANRTVGAMRIWIPQAAPSVTVHDDGDGIDGARSLVEDQTVTARRIVTRTDGGRRRLADDEGRIEDRAPGLARGVRIAGQRDRELDALADDLSDRHPQRGQRGDRVGGEEEVVEAHDRELVGDHATML